MHHFSHIFKDTIITILPSMGGMYAALEASNILLKLIAGGLTIIWLIIRIATALKDYRKAKYE